MPLSTDTTTAFTSDTGYTLFNGANITFAAGIAKLDDGYEGTGAVRTPQTDSSTWVPAINSAVVTQTEAVGYSHRFAFSFDDWTSAGRKEYKRYTTNGWELIANDETSEADLLTIIMANGMSAADVAKIRDWPENVQQVSVLVGMQRDTGGGNGTIDLITWSYGTLTESVGVEGTASGTLGFDPEYPLRVKYANDTDTVSFGTYEQVVRKATALRRAYSLSWPPQIEDDMETLVAFLQAHIETPFNWQPYGDASSRKWVALSQPKWRKLGAGVYRVTCDVEESL